MTPMSRAIIYARYSTDKQRESSIADQARVCRARATSLGAAILTLHADDGVSGSTPVALRPGGKALLADAMAGRFDILFIESLDRLSRDLVEQETIVRRLEHRGLRIVGVSDGYDTNSGASRKLTRGMRGLVNEIYLDDLRAKTHRGLSGQVGRGYHAGGLSYGYRSITGEHGHSLEIDPEAACWVRWIFEHYSSGWSCQRVAAELNRQGVRSPRGGTWAVSAIYGSPRKGSGILNNELYRGRYVWNRSQWLKDPDTGKRQRLVRPPAEWQTIERAELRVVDEALWGAARTRMGSPRCTGGSVGAGPKPRTLLGGLLRCGKCGGAVIAVDAHQYGCAARKDRGPSVCEGLRARRTTVETRVLSVVREQLLSPTAIVQMQERIRTALAARSRDSARVIATRHVRITELDRQIERLVDAVASTGMSAALRQRLLDAESERETLKSSPGNVSAVRQVPNDLLARYKRAVTDLRGSLNRDPGRSREILRELLGEIRLQPEGDEIYAEFETRPERIFLSERVASNCGCGDRIRTCDVRVTGPREGAPAACRVCLRIRRCS
jgi:site-specific DNA recombinase